MSANQRKSTPRVIKGRVQKKNSWSPTQSYYNTPQKTPAVDRLRPGRGYRHILKKKDLYDFIAILPDWEEMSKGLNAIVLAPGEWNTVGYHVPGVVHVCAWETDLWRTIRLPFYEEHRDILERLGVPCDPAADEHGEGVLCRWTENTVRAYQLLHILLHELGHHHDRMTTKSMRASRGEPYAEEYARRYEALIWKDYLKVFTLY